VGCDFSSRPDRRKPIVLAWGQAEPDGLHLVQIDRLDSLEAYARWAAEPDSWTGGFDFPFGLPRELVTGLGWPLQWEACIRHYVALERAQIREIFKAWCDARPVGAKFAHRATDRPAGSSPSMKWVNPPVAYMLHAGVLPLLDGGVHFPGLQLPLTACSPGGRRVALEAYPGLLAREVLGRRSYKTDDPAAASAARRDARAQLVDAMGVGIGPQGLAVCLSRQQRETLVDDFQGDVLDAVLCLIQAWWAVRQGAPRYGLPLDMDPLEGWITGAPRSTWSG